MKKMIFLDSEEHLQDNINKDLYFKVRSSAISYLGLANKPSLKVSGWLLRKGYPDFIIDKVITDLICEGYIDDIKYTKKVIRSRSGKKAESPRAMIRRIFNLGVPLEIAEKYVYEHFSDSETVKKDISELLHLKFKPEMVTIHEWNGEKRKKFKQKCYRFLLSRGYFAEESYNAINYLMKDETNYE